MPQKIQSPCRHTGQNSNEGQTGCLASAALAPVARRQKVSVGGAIELRRRRRSATLISELANCGCHCESDCSGDAVYQTECSQVADRQDPPGEAGDGEDQEQTLAEDQWLASAARANEQQDADDTQDQPDQTCGFRD